MPTLKNLHLVYFYIILQNYTLSLSRRIANTKNRRNRDKGIAST